MSNKPIHVLHIMPTLERGGIERQLHHIVNNLSDQFSCTIAYLWDPKDVGVNEKVELNADTQLVKINRKSKWDLLGTIRSLTYIIEKYEPDIIHLWFPPIINIPAAVIARQKRIPTISAERRSLRFHGSFRGWLTDRLHYVQHLLSSRVAANFPPNAEPFFYRYIFRKKSGVVIPNGFQMPSNCEPKENYSIDTICNILFVGRIVKQKRLDILLEACAQLQRKDIKIKLNICGPESDPSLTQSINNKINTLGLEKYVKFLGYRKDWQQIAKNFDIFVLPSDSEGMPNVLFEAMLLGLPCIATKIPEVVSWVNNGNVLLVEPGSVNELSNGLKQLYQSKALRESLGQKGKSYASQFTVKNMVNSYAELYSEMIRY